MQMSGSALKNGANGAQILGEIFGKITNRAVLL